jgi:hypothetical protein
MHSTACRAGLRSPSWPTSRRPSVRASASSGKRIAIEETVLNASVVDPDPVGSVTVWLVRIRNNCTGSGTELLTRSFCKFFFKMVQFNFYYTNTYFLRKYFKCLKSLAAVPLCTNKICQLFIWPDNTIILLSVVVVRKPHTVFNYFQFRILNTVFFYCSLCQCKFYQKLLVY